MSEKLFDIPVSVEGGKLPGELKEVEEEVRRQLDDIQSLGIEVTKIKFWPGGGESPRFYVKFPPDKQMFEVRRELERKLFDVGQKIGSNELTFYVTKRTRKSGGWSE